MYEPVLIKEKSTELEKVVWKEEKIAEMIVCGVVNICVIGCGENNMRNNEEIVLYTESIAESNSK